MDPSDNEQAQKLSIKPASLPTVFDTFLKTRDRMAGSASAASTSQPPKPTPAQSSAPKSPSAVDKEAADKHKMEGNRLMTSQQYSGAIDAYTKAIECDPSNAVYYSNRAAAHSSAGDHTSATVDSEKAIEVDPSFSKAYHRLGHAHFCMGDYTKAAAAFKRGLDIEPTNVNLQKGLRESEARMTPPATEEELPAVAPSGGLPDLGSGLAGLMQNPMLRQMMGGAGGGGGGGMPDIAALMQNPMMMQMAQQMMANGGLEELMRNPQLQNMARQFGAGGAAPGGQQ